MAGLRARLFQHHVVRDPTVNVAYWNLYSRELGQRDGRLTVIGQPLRFFHFSGFEPDQPGALSVYGSSRPVQGTVLAGLCHDHARRLLDAGYGLEPAEYRYGLTSRLKIDRPMRRVYREALVAAEANSTREPPNPFFPGRENVFIEWLNNTPDDSIKVSQYWYQA
jgi:hypothetical protein